MKTPYLDTEIKFLLFEEKTKTISFYQKQKLREYQKIKEELTKTTKQ